MAQTPGGLPYPVATDPVALGASNIQALAEAVEAKYAPGVVCYANRTSPVSIWPAAIGAGNTFPPFEQAPISRPAGMWSAADPTRITIPAGQGGVYAVHANIAYASNPAGYREVAVYRNHGTNVAYAQFLPSVAANNGPHIAALGVVTLAAGDYLELAAGQTSGVMLDGYLNNAYSGLRVWRIA